MSNLELKALLDISLGYLVFISTVGISSGLYIIRYSMCNKQSGNVENKSESLKVEGINKPNKVLKKRKR
jgi:hypothetical protein